jgi:hypothetical protein
MLGVGFPGRRREVARLRAARYGEKKGEQDALRLKLQKKSWGLPERALRGLFVAGGKPEAFKPHRGTLRFLAGGN